MKTLRILILRIRLALLRYERALRIDSVLQMYAGCPEALSPELVDPYLADVDADIAATEALIAGRRGEVRV